MRIWRKNQYRSAVINADATVADVRTTPIGANEKKSAAKSAIAMTIIVPATNQYTKYLMWCGSFVINSIIVRVAIDGATA